MATTQLTACPECKAELTKEEIKNKECWNCNWTASDSESHHEGEWDTDDDEAMPNTFKRNV